jgi:hypothetical protein
MTILNLEWTRVNLLGLVREIEVSVFIWSRQSTNRFKCVSGKALSIHGYTVSILMFTENCDRDTKETFSP